MRERAESREDWQQQEFCPRNEIADQAQEKQEQQKRRDSSKHARSDGSEQDEARLERERMLAKDVI